MTPDPTASPPLDLRDLREAESLGRAWDAWLHDDMEPTRHATSQTLSPGIAATIEDLYDRDDTPGPSTTFRRGLKRDLLHVHDALRLGAAAGVETAWAPPAATGGPTSDTAAPPPIDIRTSEKRKRPSRPERRWWPAVEFAAAMIVVAALFGLTFGNARLAEFFRDDDSGHFGSNGDGSLSGVTLGDPWLGHIRDDFALGLRPERIAAADGLVAVVSSANRSQAISLSLFNASDGVRIWTADVSEGILEGAAGRDSAPIIADGKLYFLNRAGFLYIFDIAAYPDLSGLLFSQSLPFAATASDLVVLDGIVYAVGGDPDGEGATGSYLPDLAEVDGTLFITGDASDGLVGVDPESGTIILHQTTWPIDAALGTNALWRFDPASGLVADWMQHPDLTATHVAGLGDEHLAVTYVSPDGTSNVVTIRDAQDFRTEIGTFKSDQSLHGEGIVVGDSIVLTMSDPETSLAMYAINGSGPEARQRLPWDDTSVRDESDPVIGGESAIVVSDDDIVRLYDPETGGILGQTPVGTASGEVIAIDAEGDVVFLAFEDGTVAGFELVAASPLPLAALDATPAST